MKHIAFAIGLLPLALVACTRIEVAPDPTPPDAPPAEQPSAPAARVVVNGRELTKEQMREFKERYKVEPRAGEYWYDSKSGLWGLPNQAAGGFLLAGHDFGPLAPDASKGSSHVWLNGRHMPLAEVEFFAMITGPILPGRYWLDGSGNVGYEGVEFPIGNLYQMAQMRMGAGGGDNLWSSRFAAGNYNNDNSAGYVSVPGVGPVSYGM